MMALKPVGGGLYSPYSTKQIELKFKDIDHLQLTRVYRCTKTILDFYKTVVKKLLTEPEAHKFNSYSTSYNPGHDICGDRPEILFLPECKKCNNSVQKTTPCRDPVMHNLNIFTNKTRILAFLWRLQKKLKPMKITVIIDIYGKQKCMMWLKQELEAIGISESFDIKLIGECRGMEFPSVVTISGEFVCGDILFDTWTRVTTSLR